MTLLQNSRSVWSPPFEKGGLGGISGCHAGATITQNPPRPPFRKGGRAEKPLCNSVIYPLAKQQYISSGCEITPRLGCVWISYVSIEQEYQASGRTPLLHPTSLLIRKMKCHRVLEAGQYSILPPLCTYVILRTSIRDRLYRTCSPIYKGRQCHLRPDCCT